jgi:hypothetical protein
VQLMYQVLEKGQAPFGAFFGSVEVTLVLGSKVFQVGFTIGASTHLSPGISSLSSIQAAEGVHPHSPLLTGENRTTRILADLVDRPGVVGVAVGGTTGTLFNRLVGLHRANSMTAFTKRSSPFARVFERFFAPVFFQNRMPHRP